MSTVNVNPTSNTITIIDNGTQIVTVNTQGPQGPAGAAGVSGSQGPSGSTDVPAGTISGSTQISLLGFVTSSATASFVTNSQTSSFVTNSQTSSFATTGSNNFVGDQTITGSLTISGSFHSFTLDSDNIVLGSGSGVSMQEGADGNVILGVGAGQSLTTGDDNVFIGTNAGENITGANNVLIGKDVGGGSGTAQNNIAIGDQAALNLSSGKRNIIIGQQAGGLISTGDNNIYIGHDVEPTNTGGGQSGEIKIGSGSIAVISASLVTGDILFPSTASADFFVGDGSNITGVISSSYAVTASHALNSGGGSGDGFPYTGSAAISGTLSVDGPAGHITASGNISSSGTVIAGAVTTTGNISSSAGYLYGGRVFASRGFISDLAVDTLYGGDGANTAITLNEVAGLSLLGPVTASSNISSSGTVTALTGSFGVITGLSPITVTDSITFQQPITASIISASTFSGDGSGLTNVATSSDISVYLNFEEATSYAYIVPYNLQFAGFTTSSAMTVQISSSGAPYVFTSSLSQFSTLSVTSSAAGLVTLSGSKL